MPQLHETRMGQQLITSTLPRIATALEELVEVLTKKHESERAEPSVPVVDMETNTIKESL